jgi:putative sugar O-methyltransferase
MAETSRLWGKLTREQFANIDDEFLRTFREPGSANKFVAWDPYERSARYFKFLLFAVVAKQPEAFFTAYRRLQNCNLGNPLSVQYSGCALNADYVAAVEEWLFLDGLMQFEGMQRVTEIGAGFGRTCHTLLTLCPNIREYTIVDLEPMLGLSAAYLERVAPASFDRIRFIASTDHEAQEALQAQDLAINIDSFQEMPKNVIDGYMNRIVSKAARFYCKNPVGKYLPETVGLPHLEPEQLMDVFELGYCQSVIDIFDESALQKARADYLALYTPPNNNGDYRMQASKAMDLFSYFLHVLYVRA